MSASNLEKLSLTLNPSGDSREYHIYPIQTVDINSTKEALSIAPPGLSARENILLGVSGMNADISITATAWNNGDDRANGTHTSTVTAVQEQLRYLEDAMQAPDFGAAWELNHETGVAFNDDAVFFESVDMTVLSNDSPKWKEFTIRLRRGSSTA